ncbi:NfrA family protein [Brucella sp. IR073]|uniref:NfrA family protein n=1 Tax=unclassified Brucella TaxID=2632610 RepID=UPI003B9833B7
MHLSSLAAVLMVVYLATGAAHAQTAKDGMEDSAPVAVQNGGELPLSGPAYRIAAEAYEAFERKDYGTAIAQAREAIRQRPDVGRLRTLLVQALDAAGRKDEARQEAQQAANDPVLSAAARDELKKLAAEERAPETQTAPAPPVAQPPAQPNPAYRAADTAYRAYDRRNYDLAVREARKAVKLEPANAGYRTLLTNALAAQKQKNQARRTARSAARNAARARRIAAATSPSPGGPATPTILDRAYAAVRAGDNTAAYAAFETAKRRGELHGTQLIDAAYAAKRVYRNDEAVALMREAIDAEERGEFKLAPQALFGLRREVADMTREFGASASVTYGSSGVSNAAALPSGNPGRIAQAGSEVYWRPPGIGYRNGSTFELFARQFTTLGDSRDGPTGLSTMQGSAGARWKPFPHYNLVLEASRLFKLGKHARNDTLLRAAISDGFGTDLRVDKPSWWTGQYYAEAARYMESRQNVANGEARIGRSFRMDSIDKHLVLTPFVAVGASYDSDLTKEFALGAGPGINARYWFREDKYTAPRSYVDFTLQYRVKLAGDDRAKGLFAGISVNY